MNIRRRSAYATALLAIVSLLQSCATVVQGTSQKIPVTSTPIGARVIVDGKDAGTSPLTLKLKKKKPHVIRIEQEGYNPHEIRIARTKSRYYLLTSFGNATIGSTIGLAVAPAFINEDAEGDFWTLLGKAFLTYVLVSLAASTPFIVGDAVSGANYDLSPKTLDVNLTPANGAPRLEVTEIDEAALRHVKWLRVRL